MPDLEPLLYLRAAPRELQNKGGGGSSKDPWVDIDASGLRARLLGSLDDVEQELADLPKAVQESVGVPLRITLRDEALAKSNRPTAFLAAAGTPTRAVGRPGELFTRARPSELASLTAAVRGAINKADRYAVSTIELIAAHSPMEAFDVGITSLEDVVQQARSEGRLLRLDLFPWLQTESRWGEDESLATHLQGIGLPVRGTRGTSRRQSVYVEPAGDVDLAAVEQLYGVRFAGAEPMYSPWREVAPQSMAIVGSITDEFRQRLTETEHAAIVGVLDSGIQSDALEPWVQGRETYDLGTDLNPEHGTFVAGLILAGSALNPGDDCFGPDSAVIIDGQVLPSAPIGELELLERITETVNKHPEVSVWNCSFARGSELDPMEYTVFASEMDRLSAERGILFVQAAGNYVDPPARTWPATKMLSDGIASPGDAVNSLVVGSLSHRGGRAPVGAPASYSRRGPSFGGQTKPDVSFWSGDLGPRGEVPHAGIRSIVPGDQVAESVGTSFATPLVSAIAANVWSEVEGLTEVEPSPALVKGLVMHSAAVSSRTLVGADKNYYGAGVPRGGLRSLFEGPESFTTVHHVPLQSKISWLRAPFPMPACLFTDDGKLTAEIFLTVSFTPVLNQAYGEEAVRTCVDAHFGVIERSDDRIRITGKVPEEQTSGAHPWEAELVAAGKWSPTRTHYKQFPRGCAGEEWGLKLDLTEREDFAGGIEQPAYVLLTLRGLDPGLPVHADGIREVNRLALWNTQLSERTDIRIDT